MGGEEKHLKKEMLGRSEGRQKGLTKEPTWGGKEVVAASSSIGFRGGGKEENLPNQKGAVGGTDYDGGQRRKA